MLPIQGWQGSGEGQNPQISCPGNRVRPAAGTEFAVDITGVGLDCVQREKKPGSDLSIGQSFGDELEYFTLALAKRLNQVKSRGLNS